jgi:hypothetical protein
MIFSDADRIAKDDDSAYNKYTMKKITLKISEDRKTFQIVEQSERGNLFAPPTGWFETEDGILRSVLSGPCALVKYSKKPMLMVRGEITSVDMREVKIPSLEWLERIEKTVAAYNSEYGPKN